MPPLSVLPSDVARERRVGRAAVRAFPGVLIATLFVAAVCVELGVGDLWTTVAMVVVLLAILVPWLRHAARPREGEPAGPPARSRPARLRLWLAGLVYVLVALGPALIIEEGSTVRTIGFVLTGVLVLLLIAVPVRSAWLSARSR